MTNDTALFVEKSHLKFAEMRGYNKTYCPSEVARELFPVNWRSKMDLVRTTADDLVQQNKLEFLQNSVIKSHLPTQLKGPIRLRIDFLAMVVVF